MPVYTYQCESCGVRFDRYQKFSDQSLTWCPECGKRALRKVYSPVGIVFKGSGFYSTDNRSPSGGGVNSGKSSDKGSDGEKSSTDTKSTPAPSNPAPAASGDTTSKSST